MNFLKWPEFKSEGIRSSKTVLRHFASSNNLG